MVIVSNAGVVSVKRLVFLLSGILMSYSVSAEPDFPQLTEKDVVEMTKNCDKGVMWLGSDNGLLTNKHWLKKFDKAVQYFNEKAVKQGTDQIDPGDVFLAKGLETYSDKAEKYFFRATVICGEIDTVPSKTLRFGDDFAPFIKEFAQRRQASEAN